MMYYDIQYSCHGLNNDYPPAFGSVGLLSVLSFPSTNDTRQSRISPLTSTSYTYNKEIDQHNVKPVLRCGQIIKSAMIGVMYLIPAHSIHLDSTKTQNHWAQIGLPKQYLFLLLKTGNFIKCNAVYKER